MYIEYYIIENLLINYIIISCTSILTKRYNPKIKKLLGAFVGTLYSVAYIYKDLDILFTLPFKILIMTFITLISFTYKNKKDYINISLVFYMVNVFISGSTFFIIYFTGMDHMKISFFIICVYISCELLKYIYKDIKTLRQIKYLKKTITINLLGKSCSCEALLDSGNLLKDPMSNNDVIIIKSKYLKKTITINLLGKSCSCEALLDSGNLLKDPMSNNDVIIIKSNILKEIIPEYLINCSYEDIDIIKAEEIINLLDYDISKKVRIIPYKHAIIPEYLINCSYEDIDIIKAEEIINLLDYDISKKVRIIPYKHAGSDKSNIILGIKADYIEIDKVRIGNIVLGISNFNDDNYGAILNPSILV